MKHIALLGCGVVGGGVEAICRENAAYLEKSVGDAVELKYILMRRPCPGEPWADKVVTDFSVIEHDPEIEAVAECIGGCGAAFDYVKRCLLAGKSVATANKQLIAEHGRELLEIARDHGALLLFEASVGGGIPIIRPLTNCLAANRIDAVCGILNGTTNYILTQMLQCSQSFDDALADAQRLGYAEADPTADVDGIDAQRKICILADLCFGSELPPARVPAEGIRPVAAEDAALAARLGYCIKLLARAERLPDGRFTAFVAPQLVKSGSLLAGVGGVMNAVTVRGSAAGDLFFYGAGAGRMPTASAVAADLIDCLRRDGSRGELIWGPEQPERFAAPDTIPSRWYIRYTGGCANGWTEQCASDNGWCAAITPALTRAELDAKCADLAVERAFRVLD